MSLFQRFFWQNFRHFMHVRMLLVMLLVLLTPVLMEAVKAEATPVASVQMVVAAPKVKRKGTAWFVPLKVRNPLFAGDVVQTGPKDKANLLFQDGSQVRLNVNTTIEITRPIPAGKGRTSFFHAVRGEIWARLRPGNAVRTPHAVAGVRGTEFHMKIVGDSTTLTVLEGEVEFANEIGHKMVKRSQQSTAVDGVLPTGPITIENPDFIIDWTSEVDQAIMTREKIFGTLDRKALNADLVRYERSLKVAPNTADEYLQYGNTLFDMARYSEAADQFRVANQLKPRQSKTLVHLGDALLELRELEQAEASYIAAGNVPGTNENDIAALVGRSWVQLGRDKAAQASDLAEAALDDAAKIRKPIRKSDLELATTEARIALAVALLRQTDRQTEAHDVLATVATRGAKRLQYQGHSWLAILWMGCNQSEKALVEARQATAKAPQSALAHSNLALVSFYRDDMETAEREAKMAVALNSHSVIAEVVRGQALLAQGRTEDAARVAARAVALDPKLPQAYYLLGLVDEQRKDYIHAERSLKIAQELAPHYALASEALARVTAREATQ